MGPDIYIKVRFKTSGEGGRKSSLKRKTELYRIFVDVLRWLAGKAYDCRLLIEDKKIELGKYFEIPVKFLDRDLVLPNLTVGKNITLLEGKEVAEGQVIKICER